MMKRKFLFSSLFYGAGAFGAAALLFSYFGSGYMIWGLLAAFLVIFGQLLFASLPERKRIPLWAALLVLLMAGGLLCSHILEESLLSLSLPFLSALKEPYNLEMALPKISSPESPLPAEIFLFLFMSWLFLAGSFSKAGSLIAGMVSLSLILLGFYFGINPPVPALLLSAAYLTALPVRLKSDDFSHPEIPAFAFALVLGILVSLFLPESRYQQPRILSQMQERVVSFINPYDPIFHAGNAYTGLMKGTAGRQKLGDVNGIRYSGRIIADIGSSWISHRLYLRSWSGGSYGNNQWKDLDGSDYDSIKSLFEKDKGGWYDQGAWLMEVIARSPALTQSLSNYTEKEEPLEERKKDFSVDAVYEKTRFFLIPYDAIFGADFFVYDRAPVSKDGKAYSTYVWDIPDGALLSMLEQESSGDSYFYTYKEMEKEYRAFVYRHYLDIPESVQEGLSALGPVTPVRTLSEKRQRVEEIEKFLSANYRYTVNPGKTPEGKDFITYFLTESKEGYCTSFASAAVMLLRASGIPARYVTGLTAGSEEINEAPQTADGLHQYSVNDHHAHAWAEVYVDGIGWRPVETTPGYDGTANPFPLPEDKKRNNSGAPNAPADEKDKKPQPEKKSPSPNKPQGNEEKNSQTPQQPPRNEQTPLTKQSQPSPGAQSFLRSLLLISLLLSGILLFLAFRLTAVSRLLNAAPKGKKSFNGLLDYTNRLSDYADLPRQGSYDLRKKAFLQDKRFENFDRLLDMLVQAKFSGTPLSAEEKKEAVSIVKNARKNCLSPLSLTEKIRFLLIKKL